MRPTWQYLLWWIALVLAFPAQAQTVKGWQVAKGPSDVPRCTMSASFENDIDVVIGYDSARQFTSIALFSDNWQSIKEDAEYDISIEFTGTDGKWSLTGYGMVDPPGILMVSSDDEFAVDVMLARSMVVSKGGVVIARLRMGGTHDALLAVVRCASQKLNRSKADPFAQ